MQTPRMDLENGFFRNQEADDEATRKKDTSLAFSNTHKCAYCKSPFIDNEMFEIFTLSCCKECRYQKIKFATKTSAIKDYLLNNDDIKKLKYISRPNPHRGNWHDMCLYLEDDIFKISIAKYGSIDNLEKLKSERIATIKNRKIKKMKQKIRDLKRRTFVQDRKPVTTHKHVFVGNNTLKTCTVCGLQIEQEEI